MTSEIAKDLHYLTPNPGAFWAEKHPKDERRREAWEEKHKQLKKAQNGQNPCSMSIFASHSIYLQSSSFELIL